MAEPAIALLDYLEKYIRGFLAMVESEYGDINEYYIENTEKNLCLAGLACIDQGDCEKAINCFMHPNMSETGSSWVVRQETREQLRRAEENGYLPQSSLSKSLQTVFAMKTGRSEYDSGN